MTKEKKHFGSDVQFILSAIAYSVSLGNIWRFPIHAYKNDGGCFIIPYLCCSFIFGFPMVYLELTLGQFSQCGPALIFGRLRPYAAGLGWGMAAISLLVSIYYSVIIAWILVFIISVFRGNASKWSVCGNVWNDEHCVSFLENQTCNVKLNDTKAFYFNQTCYHGSDAAIMTPLMTKNQSASTQFFENYIVRQSESMNDLEGINWPVFAALLFVWLITAFVLSHGVKLVGKLSYFTATIPIIIIASLFVRNLTLEKAVTGLRINFDGLANFQAWLDGTTQVCHSLAIGFGGLISLSSYNHRSHNCLRDAVIITVVDGIVSVFVGTTVFSVLGFMASNQNIELNSIIDEGTGIAFIAYSESLSQIPLTFIGAFLLFFTFFVLGIISQFGLTEVVCSSIYDQFPVTRRYHKIVVACICLVLFSCGIVMTTRGGIYYLNIFNDYSASFALYFLIICELILVCYIYGIRTYLKDLRNMFGCPSSFLGKAFGYSGLYFIAAWTTVAPIFVLFLLGFLLKDIMIEKNDDPPYPVWSKILSCVLMILPLISLPLVLIINIIHFRNKRIPLRYLALTSPEWSIYYTRHDDRDYSVITALSPDSETSPLQSIHKADSTETAKLAP